MTRLGSFLAPLAFALTVGPAGHSQLSWFPNAGLADADADGVPDGFRIDSLKARVSIDPLGFDGDPCLSIVAEGRAAYARVNFPVPDVANQGAEPEYRLLALRVRLRKGATVRVRWSHSANGRGSSQEVAFMPWQDADTSDWMTVRTGLTLPPGAALNRVYALVNCDEAGDAAALGSPYLEVTDGARGEGIDDPRRWEKLELSALDAEQQRGLRAGNRLRNSSFELGPAWLDYPHQTAPHLVDTCAWHGKHSMCLTAGGAFGSGNNGTLDYRLTPGRVHTLSFYARADEPGVRVGIGVVSGWQWSEDAGNLTADKPAAGLQVEPTSEWRRYWVTFIPKYAPKSCAKVCFLCSADRPGRRAYVDAVQLEEGLPSDYRPDRPVDIAAQLDAIGRPESLQHPYGLLELHEPAVFRLRAFADDATDRPLQLTCALSDYWGREVERREVAADVRGYWEGRTTFTPAAPGIYKLRVTTAAPSGEPLAAEETSFGVAPPRPEGADPDRSFFGAHVYPQTGNTLPKIARAGVRWLRLHDGNSFINDWSVVEPEPGRFDFARGDEAVAGLQAQGFRLLGRLDRPPAWVELDPQTRLPPTDAWLRYVRETVGHYQGRIDCWEVLNEPYWTYQPADYAALLKLTAPAIREANPSATVVGVCGYLEPGRYQEWFDAALGAGLRDSMDVVSHHGYLFGMPENVRPPLEDRLRLLQEWLTRDGGRPLPIWDTEWCVLSDSFYEDRLFGSDNASMRGNVAWPYRDACSWLVRQHLVSLAHGVDRLFLYAVSSTSFSLSYRSTPYHGLHEYTSLPHPTLLAYAAMVSFLDGAVFEREIDLAAPVRCCLFRRGMAPIAVLWRAGDRGDRDRVTCRLPVTARNVRAFDLMGAPCRGARETDGVLSIPVGGEPVYLETAGLTPDALAEALSRATLEPAAGPPG